MTEGATRTRGALSRMWPVVRVPPSGYDKIYRDERAAKALARIDAAVLDEGVLRLRSLSGLAGEDLARYRETLAALLRPARLPGRRPLLADLGCGLGGLTRWLADELAVDAVGLDRSQVAIGRGAGAFAEGGRVLLTVADFDAPPLPAASVDGVVSLDALYLAPEPARTLENLRRVLRPQGFVLFTAYLPDAADPGVWTERLSAAGFEQLVALDRSDPWRAMMLAKHANRWDARDRIRRELGRLGEPFLAISRAVTGHGGGRQVDHVRRYEFLAVPR